MSPPRKKVKIGPPSATHYRGCRFCDEIVLVKNYPRHLAGQHPDQDQKDLRDKKDKDIKSFFAPSSSSRDRNQSGDSALGLSGDEAGSDVPEFHDTLEAFQDFTGSEETEKDQEEEDSATNEGGGEKEKDYSPVAAEVTAEDTTAREKTGLDVPEFHDTLEAFQDVNASKETENYQEEVEEEEAEDTFPREQVKTGLDVPEFHDPLEAFQDVNASEETENYQEEVVEEEGDYSATAAKDTAEDTTARDQVNKKEVTNEDIMKVLNSLVLDLSKMNIVSDPSKTAASDCNEKLSDVDSKTGQLKLSRTIKDLEKLGFTYDGENCVLTCLCCDSSFKYSGPMEFSNDLSREFSNLKTRIKEHLNSQKHISKENEKDKQIEREKKLLSRNEKAGMIVTREAFKTIKLRNSERSFEISLLLLSKAGADIGNINNSKNFVPKIRPHLANAVRENKKSFFSTPPKETGFKRAVNLTADGGTIYHRSRHFEGEKS